MQVRVANNARLASTGGLAEEWYEAQQRPEGSNRSRYYTSATLNDRPDCNLGNVAHVVLGTAVGSEVRKTDDGCDAGPTDGISKTIREGIDCDCLHYTKSQENDE